MKGPPAKPSYATTLRTSIPTPVNTRTLSILAGLTSAALSLPSCTTTGGGHNLGPTDTAQGAIGLKSMDGIPVGGWVCVYKVRNENNTVNIRSMVHIDADGSAAQLSTFDCAFDQGWSFGAGKFAGMRRVVWSTKTKYHSAKRVGDEIYLYCHPGEKSILTSGNPPGHTLRDFMTLGGLLDKPVDELAGGPKGGVTIMKIKGRDLVMENSTDGSRWLYKATANAR